MQDERQPGPLADEKASEAAPAGHPEPEAAEVESARVLANEARDALRDDGLDDEEIRRLADTYVALDFGERVNDFIAWARERGTA